MEADEEYEMELGQNREKILENNIKYECKNCDETFSRNELHICIEKSYTCHICKKTFSRNGQLTTHMRTHHGEKYKMYHQSSESHHVPP